MGERRFHPQPIAGLCRLSEPGERAHDGAKVHRVLLVDTQDFRMRRGLDEGISFPQSLFELLAGRSPVKTTGISAADKPDSRTRSSASCTIGTGSPMFRTKSSPPAESPPACRTR